MWYEHIMRTRWTSYFFASILFPQPLRWEVMILYAFVRLFDDIVDHVWHETNKDTNTLAKYRKQFEEARRGKKNKTQIINDFVTLAKKKYINKERIDAFLDAMEMDISQKTYTSYKQLQTYMYGSAEVIWLMMMTLIGYDITQEKKIIIAAKQLGEAMQYTNFLRDIEEDWIKYGRIYIPLDEIKKYWLTHKDIISYCSKQSSPQTNRYQCIQAQIAKTKKLYRLAENSITDLHKSWQLPVHMALRMYEGILDGIEKSWYEVFQNTNKTSLRTKTKIFFTTLRQNIPKRHRRIWIGITTLFAWSIVAYLFDISIPLRDHPWVTTIIFVWATLPIVFQNRQRRRKILFVGVMLGIEAIGHNTWIPFWQYIYHSPRKEVWLFWVPIFIAFSRLLLINIASNITKNRRWTVLLVVAIDLVLEPFSTLINYRTRSGNNILTAPLANYLSRGIITFASYRIVRKWHISRLRSLLMYLTIFLYAAIVLLIQ